MFVFFVVFVGCRRIFEKLNDGVLFGLCNLCGGMKLLNENWEIIVKIC